MLSNDTDPDSALGDTLTLQSVQGATHGTVQIVSGNAVFTPTANYNGVASFTYTVVDAHGLTSTASASVIVINVPDPPVANDDAASGNEDTAITTGNVLATDADTTLTPANITSFTQGAHGAVVNNGNGTFTYTPIANFFGTDTFTYTLNDGSASDTATVTMTVNAVNDSPTISNLVVTGTTISFIATDVDGGTLSLGSTFAAVFGNPVVNNGTTTTLNITEQATAISGTLQVTDGTTAVDLIGLFLGTSGDDTENRSATSSAAAIYGFGGADDLRNGTGSDFVYGGSGNDTISSKGSADLLAGGSGDDLYNVDNFSQAVVEVAGAGTDKIFRGPGPGDGGAISYSLLLSPEVENLNVFASSSGVAVGNALNNVIETIGILDGLSGQDTLTGNATPVTGIDRFTIHSAVGGQDTITNFTQGTDFLRISTAEFGGIAALGATNLFNNANTASGNGLAQLIFDNPTSQLYYDADGVAGGEIAIAILTGITTNLTSGDFDIIA